MEANQEKENNEQANVMIEGKKAEPMIIEAPLAKVFNIYG